MDWSPLVQALIGLAAAAVPVIATRLWHWLEEVATASRVGRLAAAAQRAAGGVYADMLAAPDSAEAIERAKEAGLEVATALTAHTMRHTLSRLGGSEAELRTMIRGELGRMLAGKAVGS